MAFADWSHYNNSDTGWPTLIPSYPATNVSLLLTASYRRQAKMPEEIDTGIRRTFQETSTEFSYSAIGLSILSIGMGLAAWFGNDKEAFIRIASGLLAIVLGAAAVFFVARIVGREFRTLVVAPEGFQDTNVATEFVPWAAVTSMSVAPVYFQGRQHFHAIDVRIKDSAWNSLTLTRSAESNKRQSGNMWVLRVGKERDFQSFLAMMRAYAEAHGGLLAH
ncbi:hypothetical protein [Mesorhizobium sp. IMUNJ 23232]|uniref:hypothetical protein n=1 Tax=Mesorhizobium sp. IMUNJ 23232 TaxID=3376064 RepID=UPI0037B71BCF